MRDFERKKLYALINLAIEKNGGIDNGQFPFGLLASLLKECEIRIDEYGHGALSYDKSIVLYTFKFTDLDVLSSIESLETRLISLCDELLEDKYELAHEDGEYVVKTKLVRNIDKLEFAPKHTFEELERHLITEIKKAKHSILAAVAWFTNSNIMNALKERANEGVDVILPVDKGQIPGNTRTYDFIKKCGVLPFYVYPCLNLNTHMGSTYQNTMHHKFCIIDNEVVVYGTYNWTTKAEYNDEDLTIDKNKKSVIDFTNRFCELRKKYNKIYGWDYSSDFWE